MLSLETEDNRALFTELWRRHIYAVNLQPGRERAAKGSRGVYNYGSTELENTIAQLSDVVNRTQVHTCSDTYCLRHKKGAPSLSCKFCRFYFPRAVGEADTNKVRFFPFFPFAYIY